MQVDEEGAVARAVSGVVPRAYPATAPASEYCALVAAAGNCSERVRIIGDCLNVVNDAPHAERLGFVAHKPYAGFLRKVWSHPAAREPLSRVEKVPAHQDLTALVGAELKAAIGNDRADATAKAALLFHPQPSLVALRKANRQWEDAVDAVRHVARASV